MSMATEILETYRTCEQTYSPANAARQLKAVPETIEEPTGNFYCWHLPDGSCLMTSGRGKSYQVWVSGERE